MDVCGIGVLGVGCVRGGLYVDVCGGVCKNVGVEGMSVGV